MAQRDVTTGTRDLTHAILLVDRVRVPFDVPEREVHMQIEQELERFRQDALYVDEHWQDLLERYPEQWIAVYHKQVVCASKDPKHLIGQLKRKGIPPSEVYHALLSTKEDLLILLFP